MVEAAASRGLVEKFLIDDETHVDAFHPAVVVARFLEPIIKLRKFAVVEVLSRHHNEIHITASLVESLVGQGSPQVDADKIAA